MLIFEAKVEAFTVWTYTYASGKHVLSVVKRSQFATKEWFLSDYDKLNGGIVRFFVTKVG